MYVKDKKLYPELLWQGDIIERFPFFLFNEFNVISSGDQIPGQVELAKIIILSHTCDIQERENIIIAPILPIPNLGKDKIGTLKKQKFGYWFYLPELEIINESFIAEKILDESLVDLQRIHYLPRMVVNNFKKNRVAHMSDWGRHHLGSFLSAYFSRPIENKYV